MTTINTVIPALNMAYKKIVRNQKSTKGLIFHSDRGSQYTCLEFIELLDKYGITRSNSRKGDCWDNAVAGSFFKTIKVELIYQNKIINREEFRNKLFEYIECWYNKKRGHSAIGNMTIDEFWNNIMENKKLLIAS